jgi:hypothetical protein
MFAGLTEATRRPRHTPLEAPPRDVIKKLRQGSRRVARASACEETAPRIAENRAKRDQEAKRSRSEDCET